MPPAQAGTPSYGAGAAMPTAFMPAVAPQQAATAPVAPAPPPEPTGPPPNINLSNVDTSKVPQRFAP